MPIPFSEMEEAMSNIDLQERLDGILDKEMSLADRYFDLFLDVCSN